MGGETFQWQTGNWGDMPVIMIEMFIELSVGLNKGMEKKRERDNSKLGMKGNARRNPYA